MVKITGGIMTYTEIRHFLILEAEVYLRHAIRLQRVLHHK